MGLHCLDLLWQVSEEAFLRFWRFFPACCQRYSYAKELPRGAECIDPTQTLYAVKTDSFAVVLIVTMS